MQDSRNNGKHAGLMNSTDEHQHLNNAGATAHDSRNATGHPLYIPETEVNWGFDSVHNGETNHVLRSFTMRFSESVGGDLAKWTPDTVRDAFLREKRRFLVPTQDGRYRVLDHSASDDKKKIKYAINNIKQTMVKKAKRQADRARRAKATSGGGSGRLRTQKPPTLAKMPPIAAPTESLAVVASVFGDEDAFPPIEASFDTDAGQYPEYGAADWEPLDMPEAGPPLGRLDGDLVALSGILQDDLEANLKDFDADIIMKDLVLDPVSLGDLPPALDAMDVEFASEVFGENPETGEALEMVGFHTLPSDSNIFPSMASANLINQGV